MDRITLKIDGMSCGHCVRQVRQALDELDGVEIEQVAVGGATVSFDPGLTSTARIAQAIEEQGYAVASPSTTT